MSYEYAVVPAPKKGLKAKGVKSNEDRFAYALTTTLNQYAQQGWEYMRTDTLPSEERSGFRGKSIVHQNMLVFRRALAQPTAAVAPAPVAAPPTMADRVQPAAVAAPPRMMAVEPQPLATDPGRTEPRLGSD